MSVPPASGASLLSRARPLMLARAGAAGFTFAIPLVLARAFSQHDYGTYKQLLLIANTLANILPFGMAQGIYYFVPRSQSRRPLFIHVLLFLAGMGLLSALVLVLGADPLAARLNNDSLPALAPWLALYCLGTMAGLPLEIGQTARGQTARAAATYLASELLKALAMVAPVLLGFGLPGVMVGMAAFALARAAAAWLVLVGGESGPLFDREALRRQLRYALPMGAAMALAVPQVFFHQFVVSSRLDAAAFAIYAVGIFQLPVVDLLYTPTSEVLMVRIAELEREGQPWAAAAVFREAAAKLAQVFFPLAVFLVAAAPEFITSLFTSRYLPSVPIFRVAALAPALAIFPLDGVLRARDQTRHIFASYALKFAFTIPAVLLAVRHFGMMGGVCTWLAAELLGKSALASRLPKALGVRARELLPAAELARTAAAALLACGGVFAARTLTAGRGAAATLALAAALYGAGYLAAHWAMGTELPFGLEALWRRGARLPGPRRAA